MARERRGRNFQRSIEPGLGAHLGADDLTALDSRTRQLAEGSDATYAGELALRGEEAIRARIRRLHLKRRWP
jgi:hypothetical protein